MANLLALTESFAEEIAAKIVERISESLPTAAPASEPERPIQSVGDDDPDPILGLEHIRKTAFEPPMSKTAFYGGGGRPGFVHKLPVIEVGPRKRGVRRSALRALLDDSTSNPAV